MHLRSIYGSRASNGVVLITTAKKGKSGNKKLNLSLVLTMVPNR